MKLRHAVVLALVPMVGLGACKKRPATSPGPETTVDGGMTDAERARADSIRLANEAADRNRLERERAENARLERERLERETAGAREVLTEIVFFEFDSDEISGRAEETLRLKAAVLAANPNVRLRIEGHADQRGSTEYNLALGQRRADVARQYLRALGVSAAAIETVSFGAELPVVEGATEEIYAVNRRDELQPVSPPLLGLSE